MRNMPPRPEIWINIIGNGNNYFKFCVLEVAYVLTVCCHINFNSAIFSEAIWHHK